MKGLLAMLGIAVLGWVLGAGVERLTWNETQTRIELKQGGDVHADLEEIAEDPAIESVPVLDLDQTLQKALGQHSQYDPIGTATTVIQWMKTGKPHEIQRLLEVDTIPVEFDSFRQATWQLAMHRWAEIDGWSARSWAREQEFPMQERRNNAKPSMPLFATYLPWLKSDPSIALLATDSEGVYKASIHRRCLEFLTLRVEQSGLEDVFRSETDSQLFARTWLARGHSAKSLLQKAQANTALSEDQRAALAENVIYALSDEGFVKAAQRLLDSTASPDLIKGLRNGIWLRAAQSGFPADDPVGCLRLLIREGYFLRIITPHEGGTQLINSAIDLEPQRAAEFLMEIDESARKIMLRQIFEDSPRPSVEITAKLDLYLALPEADRPKMAEFQAYLNEESRRHPRSMFQWLADFASDYLSRPDTSEGDASWVLNSLTNNGRFLAQQDADSALNLVTDLPEGRYRDAVLKGIIQGSVTQDIEGAAELAETLTGEAAVAGQLAIVSELARTDGLDAVLPILENADDPSLRTEIVKRTIVPAANILIADRAALVDQYLHADPDLMRSVDKIALTWSQDDPRAATEWLEQYRAFDQYDRSIGNVMSSWMHHDLAAASAWLATLQPGTARDAGAEKLINIALDTDPQVALEWSATLTDPKSRERALQKATEAVQRYGLSDR